MNRLSKLLNLTFFLIIKTNSLHCNDVEIQTVIDAKKSTYREITADSAKDTM